MNYQIQQEKIKEINEDMFVNATGVFPDIYLGPFVKDIYEAMRKNLLIRHSTFNEPKFIVQRNLRDDTFNLGLSIKDEIPNTFYVSTRFQVGSKNIDAHIPVHSAQTSLLINDKLPHTLMNDLKFNKVKFLAGGIDIDEQQRNVHSYDKRRDIAGFMLLINNISKNQTISVSSNDIIKIKTVNSIILEKSTPIKLINNPHIFNEGIGNILIKHKKQKKKNNIKLSFSYNNLFLIPREISQFSHNKVLYDAYMNNDDSTPIIGDIKFTNGAMMTSATGKTPMQVNFHSKILENKKKTINNKEAQYLGYLSVDDYSYYDYEDKKTKIGPSSDSKLGDLIPYDINGNYIRSIMIGFNCDFDSLKIYESKKISQPILGKTHGAIKLNITNEEKDNSIKMSILSKHDLEFLKKSEDFLTLTEMME